MRKPAPTSSRNYFTKETDEWVVRYCQSTDPDERNKIFQEHLYYPFYKLAENIINTFKFYHMDVDSVEDLKLDVVTMIMQDKLPGFDPTRGTKAFSYFGTIIKRWLIAYSNANYARKLRQSDIRNYEDVLSESSDIEAAPTITLASFFDNWIEDMYEKMPEMFPAEEDQKIADAILTVFRNRYNIEKINQERRERGEEEEDLFKKKTFYIYVREITGCDTPYLTKIIKIFKDDFFEKYNKLVQEGLIRVEESEV